MDWLQFDLASHPVAAFLGFLLGYRRGQWLGLALLGFVVGWGSLPVAWLLTREARPEKTGGQGLNAAEVPEEQSDWDQWRTYYFNLRQDLVVQVLLSVLGLFSILWVTSGLVCPRVLSFTDKGRALAWAGSCLWPLLLMRLAQSTYRLPWLGPVWRYSDQIWLTSGLKMPADVRWRCQKCAPVMSQEDAHAGLLEAVARSHQLFNLGRVIWSLLVALVVFSTFWAIHQVTVGRH